MIVRFLIIAVALVCVIAAAWFHASAKHHYRNGDIRRGDRDDLRGDYFFTAAIAIALVTGVWASW